MEKGYRYKRFMVFHFEDYEHQQGLFGCSNDYDTFEEAKHYVQTSNDLFRNNYEIFDRVEGYVIEEGERKKYVLEDWKVKVYEV